MNSQPERGLRDPEKDVTDECRDGRRTSGAACMLHERFGPASGNFFVAKREVERLHREGGLTEDAVFEFAYTLRAAETACALAILWDVPFCVAERVIVDDDRSRLLTMLGALGFAWETVMAVLFLRASNHRIAESELARLRAGYEAAARSESPFTDPPLRDHAIRRVTR
jgi:hypothetical protein